MNKRTDGFRLKRTRQQIKLETLRNQRLVEYNYLIRVKATNIVIENLEQILQFKLHLDQELELKQLIEVIKSHIFHISKQMESQSWDVYEEIIKKGSLIIFENTCNYVYITFTQGDNINDEIKKQIKPYLQKLKYQSNNIVQYFKMLDKEYQLRK